MENNPKQSGRLFYEAEHTVSYHCPAETKEELELFLSYIKTLWQIREEESKGEANE